MKNLVELNIDATQLKGRDLINLFKLNPNNKLRELSCWELDGKTWKENVRGYENGIITKGEL
jgi:hypothetical protein